jgi:nitric oxide reductase subunit B
MRYTRLWVGLAVVIVTSFAVLGYFGGEIYRQAPPVPARVVMADGVVVFTGQEIRDGQNVWQSLGGQEVGSIWGHGAYVAPDWSADWLHREATWLLDHWAVAAHNRPYAQLDEVAQAVLRSRLKRVIRTNTYDPATGDLTVSGDRAAALSAVSQHYTALFSNDPALHALRDAYALPANAIKDARRQRALNAFFFWTAWACGTNRPGSDITYTNNWPAEALIDNVPTGAMVLWSVISFVLLLAGIGALAWYYAAQKHTEAEAAATIPAEDPLLGLRPTPSMQATRKYFWTVAALLVVQVGLGAVTAHYGVEGSGFYGLPLAEWLPYAVTRTWHVQLGIFWIATAWLATGLFVAPAVSGSEPRWQRAGVNFLFVCLLIIVVGSLVGQWLAVQQRLELTTNFWFGHQGYEYVDLGRFWQIFLLVGLCLWLLLMHRAMRQALRRAHEERHLLLLFFIASVAIPLFYGAGLMWGRTTNLAIAEYWRW